jgi:cytoskeleton protein RodZ
VENSDTGEVTVVSPGEMLSSAREKMGISRREMADRLNWMPSYIAAVEENRFEELRGAVFVRGYLRAYGKLLGLSEQTLMDAYNVFGGSDATAKENGKRVESRVPQVQKKGIAIPAGAAVVVLVVFLLWYLRADQEQGVVVTAPVSAESSEVDVPEQAEQLVQELSLPLPKNALSDPVASDAEQLDEPQPAAEEDSTSSWADVTPEAAPTGQDELAAVVQTEMGSEPGTDAAGASDTGGAGGLPSAAVEADLVLRFSGDCWTEVRNAAGEIIYADLSGAGDTVNLDGDAPFDILLGDSTVVEIEYLKTPVTIQRRPGRVIARFKVGEQ